MLDKRRIEKIIVVTTPADLRQSQHKYLSENQKHFPFKKCLCSVCFYTIQVCRAIDYFHVLGHHASFFRPKCLTLRGHVTALTTVTWQQKFIDQRYELPSTMNFCCHVIVVKAVTWHQRVRQLGLKRYAWCIRKLATSENQDSLRKRFT